EARIHRKPVDQVHFHEVGAVDAVVDIVGSALLLHDLDVTEVWASPVATGTGLVRSEHGMLPVPAPAVVELLGGVPIYSGGVAAELTTPTGAAILAASAGRFTELPPMPVAAPGAGRARRGRARRRLVRPGPHEEGPARHPPFGPVRPGHRRGRARAAVARDLNPRRARAARPPAADSS